MDSRIFTKWIGLSDFNIIITIVWHIFILNVGGRSRACTLFLPIVQGPKCTEIWPSPLFILQNYSCTRKSRAWCAGKDHVAYIRLIGADLHPSNTSSFKILVTAEKTSTRKTQYLDGFLEYISYCMQRHIMELDSRPYP